jgi:hypothetical protein
MAGGTMLWGPERATNKISAPFFDRYRSARVAGSLPDFFLETFNIFYKKITEQFQILPAVN